MGTAAPKRFEISDPEVWGRERIDLIEMEEHVKDAILTDEFSDLVLLRLVDLTITAIQEERPLFPNLLEEPAFYRKNFRLWVREAMEERKALEQAQEGPLLEE